MIELPRLPAALAAAGPTGASLVSLGKSPTSRAAVGILAERTVFKADDVSSTGKIELRKCHDRAIEGNPLPSPFAVVCLDTLSIASEAEAQSTCSELLDLLRAEDLHRKPVIVLVNGNAALVGPTLRYSDTPFTVFDTAELLDVLLAHPHSPRTALMRRIRARTPIGLLNPYIYRGPIGENLFRGREHQLNRLTGLQTSYALIGPRAIGKTSLMNRAQEKLQKQGVYAVSVEYSEATGEHGLCSQIIDAFIRLYGADEKLRAKVSPQRVQRLIQDYVMRSTPRTVALLVDEADLLNERCPELTATFRLCHNNGLAKFVFLGFTKLRKAISDRTNSIMANFPEELSLSGLRLEECGSLITQPMGELGVQLSNVDEVVRTIYHETAGSPSRIQLLCHFIVEGLDGSASRIVGKGEALAVMRHPEVRKFFNAWFFESTTPTMRWLAAVATLYAPCTDLELMDHATQNFHEITGLDVKSEINDLVTANILEYRRDGTVDFSFPAMRDVARPAGAVSDTMAELRRTARVFRQGWPR